MLDAFVDRWFGNVTDSFKAGFKTFATSDVFKETLKSE
jgi:hypothetical protein